MSSQSDLERRRRLQAYLRKVFGEERQDWVLEQLEASTKRDEEESQLESLEVARSDAGSTDSLDSLEVRIADPSGKDLLDSELDALEAIIHEEGRPAIKIREGSYDLGNVSTEWQFLGETEPRQVIESAIKSVCRIEAPRDLRRPYAGTGFVVGDHLIMTNRHVARIFTGDTGSSVLNFYPGATAGVDFLREFRSTPQVLEVDKILMVHPYWDMALLRVKQNLANDFDPLKLSTKSTEQLRVKTTVVAIGYPGKDSRGDRRVRDDVFDGYYGIKRLLPGEYDGPAEFHNRAVMAHDTSTLGGASGSVVLDIDSGEVIGLHYAGIYLESNYAVPMGSLAEDSRVSEFRPKLNFQGARTPSVKMQEVWNQVDKGDDVSPIETTDADEIFFSSPPDITPILPKFNYAALKSQDFQWKAALSTALASHVVYSDEGRVNKVCGSWNLERCEFIERANTQCFVAGNSELALVSFRGTEKKIGDWLIDLNAFWINRSYGRVHRGFWFAFESVAALIDDAISKLGSPKLVLTGHSLGGALTLVAAAEWAANKKHEVLSVYTFGQPAVGQGMFPEYLDTNYKDRYHRFVNDDDIVPMVPPTYRHAGTLHHFGPSTELKAAATSRNENLVEMSETCSEAQFDHLRLMLLQEKLTSNNAEGLSEEGFLPSFRDHSMARYVEKIAMRV